MSIDHENLFNKSELFLLKKIGIEFHGNEIHVLTQGKRQKLVKILQISTVDKISIHKTSERHFSWLSIFNIFNQSMLMETDESASQIYSLKFHLKNGAKPRTKVMDFDLITISKLLAKINEALKKNV